MPSDNEQAAAAERADQNAPPARQEPLGEAQPLPPSPEPEIVFASSGATGKLTAALAKAQLAFGPVKKNVENSFFSTESKHAMYADLSSLIEATQKALADNELVVIQKPKVDFAGRRAGCHTKLSHASGEWESMELLLPAVSKSSYWKAGAKMDYWKFDAQTIGAAITYSRRYSYAPMIGVCAETDFDANEIGEANDGSREAQKEVARRKTQEAVANGKLEQPVIFYLWYDESQTATLQGPKSELDKHAKLLSKLRMKGQKDVVLNSEDFNSFEYEMTQIGVILRRLTPPGK